MGRYQSVGRMALLPLLLLLLSPAAHAWSWIPFYNNAYNITVPNWNYTGQGGFQYPSAFLMAKLPITDFNYMTILGYGSNGQSLGFVNYTIIANLNGNTVILMSKTTNESQPWSFATVYYNNLYENVPTYYSSGLPAGAYGLGEALPTPYTYTGGKAPQYFNVYYPNYIINGTAQTNIGNLFTPIYSTSNVLYLNFTSYTQRNLNGVGSSFLLVSNNSLTYRGLNISWYPISSGATQSYLVNTTGNLYKLQSNGYGSGGPVSSPPLFSPNANEIFNGGLTNNGFEAWFYYTGNQIAVDGMSTTFGTCFVVNCYVYNSIVPESFRGVGVGSKLIYNEFFMNITANVPTRYALMPAFTTNFIASNMLTNTNAIAVTSSKYQYYVQVSNIPWSYTWNSLARADQYGPPYNTIGFSYGPSQVAYALVTIPHYSNMAPSCSDLDPQAYDPTTNLSLGAVNFYLYNCTPTGQNATILITNTTLTNNIFNSIRIYFDTFSSTYGIYGQSTSNTAVYNGWQFESGSVWNTVSIPNAYTSLPFIINIASPLNLNSNIIATIPGFGYMAYKNLNGYTAVNGLYSLTQETKIDLSGIPSTSFIYQFGWYLPGYGYQNGLLTTSKTLSAFACVEPAGSPIAFNTSNTLVWQSATRISSGSCNSGSQIYVNLTGGNSGTARYLADSVSCNVTSIGLAQNGCAIYRVFNSLINTSAPLPFPTISTTIPQTANGLGLGATTTINVNAANTPMLTIAPGVEFPKAALIIIGVIIMIIGLGTMSNNEIGHFSFVVVLIGLYVMGLYQLPILAIAIIGTMAFVMEEYVNRKNPKSVFYHG